MLGGALDSARYDDKWYGAPWEPSSKLFFYNTDMLAKVRATPADLRTWDGVLSVAKKLKAAGVVEYPIAWSWSQSEALVCDYAQLLGSWGGSFLDDRGKLDLNSTAAVQTLAWMKATIDAGLTNPASLSAVEDDVNKGLGAGRAAFGLNWNSTYNALQNASESKIAGKVGVLPTPSGPDGDRTSVNGSMSLAITKSSEVKSAAWTFIEYLTSRPVQDKYLANSPSNWKSTYTDHASAGGDAAYVDASAAAYESMILRPQVPQYGSVSRVLQRALQEALLGRKTPQQALDAAAAEVGSADR
jgi:multiple sugar transport system substrate-binding protein